MAYNFMFDLSKMSQKFFQDIVKFSEKKHVHNKVGSAAKFVTKKFRVDTITGLPVTDSLTVIQDLIDTHVKNVADRDAFLKTNKRVLFLPHCSRKHMDSKCKAEFDGSIPTYICKSCSSDCLVNKATKLGKKKGYDVYIVPGGSGIRNILAKNKYDGLVGVACTEEVKLGMQLTKHLGIATQAVPLLKNGCSATKFNIASLKETL